MGLLRPLYDNVLAAEFVKGVLGLTKTDDIAVAVKAIVKAELQLKNTSLEPTIYSTAYRSYGYTTNEVRFELGEKIFEELISMPRLENDDDIEMGKGGALPLSGVVKSDRQAFIITGLPASGKSGVANKIADHYGAVIIDSDYAKRKFPEFASDFGASLVHEEASRVVFGDEKNNNRFLLEACMIKGHNIVIPKIGYNSQELIRFANKLTEEKYCVHLLLVSLDRVKATQRAYRRYIKTNRYVPLSLVLDIYGNDPILTYYRVRENSCWETYGKISSDVLEGHPFEIIHEKSGSPVKLFR